MSTYQVAWNATTKVVKIQPDGSTVGAGFTDIGSYDHDDDADDELGIDENHVLYHHVRDLLYEEGVQDMQSVDITIPVISITSLPATDNLDLSEAETVQIINTIVPSNAINPVITYESSDPTKATVSASGLVTPVAAGESTITVTVTVDDESTATDTAVITVVA